MSLKVHISNTNEVENTTIRQRRKSIGNDFMKNHGSNNDNDVDQPKIRKERSTGSVAMTENDKQQSPSNTPRRRNSISEFPSKSKKKSADFSVKSDNYTHNKKLFKKRVSFSKPLIDPALEIQYENPILWNDDYDEDEDYHKNYSDSYIISNPIRMIRRNSKNGYINGKDGIWRKFVPFSSQIPACTLS